MLFALLDCAACCDCVAAIWVCLFELLGCAQAAAPVLTIVGPAASDIERHVSEIRPIASAAFNFSRSCGFNSKVAVPPANAF